MKKNCKHHYPSSGIGLRAGLTATLIFGVGGICSSAFAQDSQQVFGGGTFDEGPGGNLTEETIEIRKERQSGQKKDSVLPEKFEPLHKLWDPFADKLMEKGFDLSLRYVAQYQHASDLITGIENTVPGAQKDLAGGDFDLVAKWHLYEPGEAWAGYFRMSVEYRHAYTDLPAVALGPIAGSNWLTVKGWTEYDHIAITETFWHQGTIKSPFEYRIGRLKNTSIWNGGKYVDANSGMVGANLSDTPAFDTPSAGWSANIVYHPVDGTTHIMVGVFQANGNNEDIEPLHFDQLTYGLQLGWKPKGGSGQGRYHIFLWHIDETEDTADANGFALNLEQGFGNWTPFIRYSFGDQDENDSNARAIRQSANLGIGYDQVFGRSKDWIAIVATWAGPTDSSLRDQYGMELDYAFRLFPHVTLTPNVQWIIDPSENLDKDNIWLAGVRAKFEF